MLRVNPIRRWLAVGGALTFAGVLLLQGCGDILKVVDPDIILGANSKAGAIALRNGVFLRLSQAVNGIQGPDALFVFSGLMADEWRSGDTFVQRNNQDQRVWQPENTFNATPYRALNRIRIEGGRAIEATRIYDPTGSIASMFALTAYAEVMVAELYCNGTPLSGLDGSTIVYGDPITNDSVLKLAIANADSAIATGGANSREVLLARVVKARALVDRGQYAAAAVVTTTPTPVPTTFKFLVYHSSVTTTNQVWALNNNARRYTIPNGREGGVGIDFVTPNDPRLPRQIGGASVFDNSVPMTLVRQALFGQFDSIPIATGIEARLIEAEANLQPGGDRAAWLFAINALRTDTTLYPKLGTGFGYAPLPPGSTLISITKGANLTALADPGTDSARVDAHFRERAFWLFSTGHRLGDMRRLIRPTAQGGYGRLEAQVYPSGTFVKGGNYGDATMMPVPFDEVNNPKFTQCLDRNP